MCQKLIGVYAAVLKMLEAVQPAVLLGVRVWMAKVFFVSGWLKLMNWDNTLLLFTYEHPVPFLPPLLAAVSGTFFEIVCPLALVLGVATRLATLPLLAMTAVIQFTYLDHLQHYYWAMLLLIMLFVGPGKWSVDAWLAKKFPALGGRY